MTNDNRKGLWSRLFGREADKPAEKPVDAVKAKEGMVITPEAVARTRLAGSPEAKPFKPAPIPQFIQDEFKKAGHQELAMDGTISSAADWAGGYAQAYGGAYTYSFTEGLQFLGYPYLAELAQRPEYRRMVEIMAQEMTRKWIRITSADDGDDDKANDDARSDKIAKIVEEMDRLNVREVFKTIAEHDGFYGRAHLYIDTGDSDDPDELKTPLGNGDDAISKAKVTKKKPIMAIRAIEAVWTYPTNYNSNDPLKADWYNPDMWFVMGKQVHVSRLLPFIGRPVPDLLKPAYSFGGLALTQMAKPYVDNWLQTRQSINDLLSAFSVMVLSTNMSSVLQGGGMEAEMARAAIFNNLRNNRGVFMIDKNEEEFKNVNAPISGLEGLQAQSQEHMSAVCGVPLVKLLGITPTGLNSSSEGEIRVFYDSVNALQEAFFRDNLTKVLNFIQLSLFNEVDPAIVFKFEPLMSMDDKQIAEARKMDAETAQILIDSGVISPDEERKRLASDPDTPYHTLGTDEEDTPDLIEEEAEGLVPKGGGTATKQLFKAEEVE